MLRIPALMVAIMLLLSPIASAATPDISLTAQEALTKYNTYIESYSHDEMTKVAQYRETYAGIKGSVADNVIERAIWYMDNGYMVYGHYWPNGYLNYGIVDCSNFTRLVYGNFGFDITSTAKNYNTVGTLVSGVTAVKVSGKWQVRGTDNLRPGDIMTWYREDASGQKYISHVAIFMGMLNGQPAVIGTRSEGNPTAIGIVNDFRYWWGEYLFSVRRVLPEGAWGPSQVLPGHEDTGVVIPKQYVLAPQRPVPLPGQSLYTIAPGDTLWRIAQEHGTSIAVLTQLNSLSTVTIYPGQVLIIPARDNVPDTHLVRAGDTLWLIARQNNLALPALLAKNPQITAAGSIMPGDLVYL